jgi:hypothetical protein
VKTFCADSRLGLKSEEVISKIHVLILTCHLSYYIPYLHPMLHTIPRSGKSNKDRQYNVQKKKDKQLSTIFIFNDNHRGKN